MKKSFEFLKKKLKVFSFLSIIFLIIFVNMSSVFANYLDEETEYNKKELQLFEKIHMIHDAFPNQIDEVALYATLVHRGTLTDYIEESYDPNFDSGEYKNTWNSLANDINNLINNVGQSITTIGDALISAGECMLSGGTDENGQKYDTDCVLEKTIEKYADRLSDTGDSSLESKIKKPKAVDLLFAASIVMLDSSGWIGTYSDENYKQALAGDGFVGNMFDKNNPLQNFASVAMNGVFCTELTVIDLSLSWFDPGFEISENGFGVEENAMAGKLSRYYTLSNICQKGFIGGTYDHVKNPDLSTETGKEQYQEKKDIVAEQILQLAEYFRTLMADDCVYVETTTNSEITNWRQYDEAWANQALGSGGETIGSAGCLITSMSYLIAKSGTKLAISDLNPSTFEKNAQFSGSALVWDFSGIAPNFKTADGNAEHPINASNMVEKITEALNTPINGHQQHLVIYLNYTGTHWVAVDHVENGVIYILDPSSSTKEGLVPLDSNVSRFGPNGEGVAFYKSFIATDVTGSGTSTSYTTTTLDVNSSDYQARLKNLDKYRQNGELASFEIVDGQGWPMRNAGCVLSSLMAIYYMFTGDNFDVREFVDDAVASKIWTKAGQGDGMKFSSPNLVPDFTARWGLSGEKIDANVDSIVDALSSGKKILIHLGPGSSMYPTGGGHYIMIDHINPTTNEVYVFNPNGQNTGYQSLDVVRRQIIPYLKVINGSTRSPYAISSNGLNGSEICETPSTGDLNDLAEFLAYLEGTETCNYKGRGPGTGYTSYNLNDGAGMTSAFGVTMETGAPFAKEIGYTSYRSDMNSGCTDKEYMEQIFAKSLEDYVQQTRNLVEKYNVNLSETQILALTSITYNTGAGGGIVSVLETIEKYGINSLNVWNCLVRRGCSYSTFYDLSSRRAAEYEALMTGNFNASKPPFGEERINGINTLQKLEDYKKTYWPSSR